MKSAFIDEALQAAILADADYRGRPEGVLGSLELADLNNRVACAMSTTNGDTGECILTARQLALLLEAAVDRQLLQEKLKDVVAGFNVIEKNLSIAAKTDPSLAPFPLVGEEAVLHQKAGASAYQHALEMCNSQSLTAFVENSFAEPNLKSRKTLQP